MHRRSLTSAAYKPFVGRTITLALLRDRFEESSCMNLAPNVGGSAYATHRVGCEIPALPKDARRRHACVCPATPRTLKARKRRRSHPPRIRRHLDHELLRDQMYRISKKATAYSRLIDVRLDSVSTRQLSALWSAHVFILIRLQRRPRMCTNRLNPLSPFASIAGQDDHIALSMQTHPHDGQIAKTPRQLAISRAPHLHPL